MSPWIKQEYERLRRKDWPAKDALRAAKVRDQWDDLENEGKVRIVSEPSPDLYDDSYIDTWTDVSQAKREQARKELWARIERDGVWMYASEFWDEEIQDWKSADAIGDFVGNEFRDSGYDTDLREAAIEAYEESLFRSGLKGTG